MPDLAFQITGVEAAADSIVPLLQFKGVARNASAEKIHSVLLHAQIQIQAPRRPYTAREKNNLVELFGTPERWGQTLRNRLWTCVDTTIGRVEDETDVSFSVPCTFDLSVASAKYLYGLEAGEIPLLFLFSGTVFYASPAGALQVQPISWNTEAEYRLPVSVWRDLMESHFPNSAWLYLRRDVFDRLYSLKRAHGDASWEQTIERLLPAGEIAGQKEAVPA